MVRWMRTLQITGPGPRNFMAWMKDFSDYMKQNHSKYSAQVFFDSFGEGGMVRFFIDFEDLAALEKFMQEVNDDQGYWQRVEKSKDLFVEGSLYDVVMRSI